MSYSPIFTLEILHPATLRLQKKRSHRSGKFGRCPSHRLWVLSHGWLATQMPCFILQNIKINLVPDPWIDLRHAAVPMIVEFLHTKRHFELPTLVDIRSCVDTVYNLIHPTPPKLSDNPVIKAFFSS